MKRRDDRTLLQDMIDTAQSALVAVSHCGFDALAANHVWTLGLVKCLEIVGEAAARLSGDFKSRHPGVPWTAIIGMRNRLVHAYFDIDYEQVWKALTEELPPLVEQLEAILSSESENET